MGFTAVKRKRKNTQSLPIIKGVSSFNVFKYFAKFCKLLQIQKLQQKLEDWFLPNDTWLLLIATNDVCLNSFQSSITGTRSNVST